MSSRKHVAVVVPAYNEAQSIGRTLDALTNQVTDVPHQIFVVNNASTDRTAEIARSYADVVVIDEPTKGTGYAVNTGFSYAIGNGGPRLEAVLRTDADTVPREDWIDAASTFLGREPHKQLITGAVLPLQDAFYRPSDEVVLPVAYVGYRLGAAALQRSTWPLRVVRGANMAVRPEAYTAVGGFPNGTIAEQDEDIELTKRMHTAYGFDALANVENMVVRTSMRRIRTVGLHGLVAYYTYRSGRPDPSQRDRLSGGDIDIRNIPKKNRKLF